LKQDDAGRALEKNSIAFAALNYEYYRLAGFDIRGVLTMSRFAKDSYVENPYITQFIQTQTTSSKSYYHQHENSRKLKKLLDMISTYAYSHTHPSSSKAGGSKWKESASLERNLCYVQAPGALF
jgi:hypothetical protein